jgi:hypothetical protein
VKALVFRESSLASQQQLVAWKGFCISYLDFRRVCDVHLLEAGGCQVWPTLDGVVEASLRTATQNNLQTFELLDQGRRCAGPHSPCASQDKYAFA